MRLLSKGFAVIALLMAFMSPALAEEATPHGGAGSLVSMLPMLIIFILVFYFLLIRPQSKRAKQHRQLVADLKVGDEVLTSAGILGRIEKLKDDYMVLNIADRVNITIQKSAIAASVPKGTMDSAS